jgi:hypothetical protein
VQASVLWPAPPNVTETRGMTPNVKLGNKCEAGEGEKTSATSCETRRVEGTSEQL